MSAQLQSSSGGPASAAGAQLAKAQRLLARARGARGADAPASSAVAEQASAQRGLEEARVDQVNAQFQSQAAMDDVIPPDFFEGLDVEGDGRGLDEADASFEPGEPLEMERVERPAAVAAASASQPPAAQPKRAFTGFATSMAMPRRAAPGGFGGGLGGSAGRSSVNAGTSSSNRGFAAPSAAPAPGQNKPVSGFAKLSPAQSAVNGASRAGEDFGKALPDAKVDEMGMPQGYPSEADWPDSTRPAGSMFSAEQWAQARQAAAEHGNDFVYEIQVGNPIEAILMAVPNSGTRAARAASSEPTSNLAVIDGKLTKVQAQPDAPWDDPFGWTLDGTLVVSRRSPAQFPGAAEGGLEVLEGGHQSWYRFIRPREHYSDPVRSMLVGSKLRLAGDGSMARPRAVPVMVLGDPSTPDTAAASGDRGEQQISHAATLEDRDRMEEASYQLGDQAALDIEEEAGDEERAASPSP